MICCCVRHVVIITLHPVIWKTKLEYYYLSCFLVVHLYQGSLNERRINDRENDVNLSFLFVFLVIQSTLSQTHIPRAWGGGGTCSIHDGGGVRRSFILQTQKNTWAWNFTHKKVPSTQKNTRLSTSTLIYSIKQTLRPKKYVTDLLTQKNTEGVNFHPKKNTSDLPVRYTTSTPPGRTSSGLASTACLREVPSLFKVFRYSKMTEKQPTGTNTSWPFQRGVRKARSNYKGKCELL